MFKLCLYIPESHLEPVKQALFAAGAGTIGHYDQCCWQVAGQGQFRPMPGSSPFLGSTFELEQVTEYRVEMVVAEDRVDAVVTALRTAHPYEEPAFDLIRTESV